MVDIIQTQHRPYTTIRCPLRILCLNSSCVVKNKLIYEDKCGYLVDFYRTFSGISMFEFGHQTWKQCLLLSEVS